MAASATSTEKTARPHKLRRATLADLTGKKAMRDEFSVPFGPDGGNVSFLFVSIGAKRYDVLLAKYPPTTEQRAAGATFNADTFAPALLAEVSVEPAIDVAGWNEVWNSESWNRGEVAALFWRAVELCNARVDVNPIEAG